MASDFYPPQGIQSGGVIKTANDYAVTGPISGNATTTLFSYTGKGMMIVTVWGDGNSAVNINYQADGGSTTLITTSDQRLLVPIVFQSSLILTATNTSSSSSTTSTVQSQGTYQ